MSSRMAWRTAGNVGRGGGPLILFFPPCCFKPAILEESVGDHRHERMTVKALPGSALEVVHLITSSASASSDVGTVRPKHPGSLGFEHHFELRRLHDRQ